MKRLLAAAFAALALNGADMAQAQQTITYPAPREGNWVAKDFKFHTGEVMSDLNEHYWTVGEPSGEPVLILHGTTQSGASLLNPNFAGQLFGPGQPLDATKYFIVLPDSIGSGKSTKPSDGLRAKFPRYDYDDMVSAQYRLVTEGLGLRHLRLVMGNSMGGMHVWLWGEQHPDFMDALAPMASLPTELSGRNWLMRRYLIEAVRNDPAYDNGNYTVQPPSLRFAAMLFNTGTSGGDLGWHRRAPTRAAADELVDEALSAPSAYPDANDYIYQWRSSSDYDASRQLERIQASLLAINSSDDERNPPELGIMEHEIKRVKKGSYYLIPASPETFGHGTTAFAKFYAKQLQDFLQKAPHHRV
jgi:homoserine O-acetyltransferase/O-succinyltransferase